VIQEKQSLIGLLMIEMMRQMFSIILLEAGIHILGLLVIAIMSLSSFALLNLEEM